MVDLNGQLSLHPQIQIARVSIGEEHLPVLVIDNFLSHPEILVEYAAAHSAFDGTADAFYPGCRAPIPPIYCFALRAFLGDILAPAFGLRGQVTGELSHFSLVTTPPASLHPLQRLPHFDTTNPKQLAVLHYLCDPRYGGTSFYRHRRSGFEFIDAARKDRYARAIDSDLAEFGQPPARYIRGDDAMYEQTASFAATFNRVLVYRSVYLHSADIHPEGPFDASPRTGRLTANTFFYYP